MIPNPDDQNRRVGLLCNPYAGSDATGTRADTLVTTREMVAAGADLLVIVAGDGTYNHALAGMRMVGANVPIFGSSQWWCLTRSPTATRPASS